MRLRNKFAILAGALLVCTSSVASNNEHYVLHYDSGDTFDVQLTEDTITWKALEGPEKGYGETDYLKRTSLGSKIEVAHWTETTGVFVTLILDLNQLKTVSSIKAGNDSVLLNGSIEIPN